MLLEIRDLWPESILAVDAMRLRIGLRLLETLERWMYGAARRVVTVGDGYRTRLIERGVDPSRVSVVMNGVDSRRFFAREPDRSLAGRLGVAGRFVVTYCGTIGMAHSLEVVLRAGALLIERGRRDVVFLLVGDGARRTRQRDLCGASRHRRHPVGTNRLVGMDPARIVAAFRDVASAPRPGQAPPLWDGRSADRYRRGPGREAAAAERRLMQDPVVMLDGSDPRPSSPCYRVQEEVSLWKPDSPW